MHEVILRGGVMPRKEINPLSFAVMILYVFLLHDGFRFLFGEIPDAYGRAEAAYRMFISFVILVFYLKKSLYAWHSLWLMVPIPLGFTLQNWFFPPQGQPFSHGSVAFGIMLTIGTWPFLMWLRPRYVEYLRSLRAETDC